VLAQDLHADGALAGDHFRIVERMHEAQPLALLEFQRVRVRVIVGFAGEHHFAAAALDGQHLDLWRRRRHHDHCPAADLGRRQRDTLRMVAGRGTDHAALELVGGEMGDLVVGAAQLEGKDRLQSSRFSRTRLPMRADRAGAGSSGVSIATS
jgi:hypothetical protein